MDNGPKRHNPIVGVFDNGGQTTDRYTIGLEDGSCLVLSPDCDKPEGDSIWCTNYIGEEDLGEEIRFEDLPLNVQEHAKKELGIK